MGTRNSTMVISEGETKVAQYGQWDGYPSGQGQTVLDFLRTADLAVFKEKVDQLSELTEEERERINTILKESDAGLNKLYPEYSRDTAAEILHLIYEDKISNKMLQLDKDFINDGLFCEWAYIIDLDKNTLEVANGASAVYELNNLPTDEEFLKLGQEEDEDQTW